MDFGMPQVTRRGPTRQGIGRVLESILPAMQGMGIGGILGSPLLGILPQLLSLGKQPPELNVSRRPHQMPGPRIGGSGVDRLLGGKGY